MTTRGHESQRPSAAPRAFQPAAVLLIVSTVCFSWLTMMMVHESGHVLHAWISGGTVVKVVLHPLQISRTDVSPNPHSHFVAWGGAVWGSLLPIAAWLITRRRWIAVEYVFRFFSGFCLIANGAYLGAGAWFSVGDTRVLLEQGTPQWGLALFGLVTICVGLRFWNGLGSFFGIGAEPARVDPRVAVTMTLAALFIALIELAVS